MEDAVVLGEQGACDAALNALKQHRGHDEVVEHASAALRNLALSIRNAEAIGANADTIPFLCDVLESTMLESPPNEWLCQLLQRLAKLPRNKFQILRSTSTRAHNALVADA
jgi:hypothetical protein